MEVCRRSSWLLLLLGVSLLASTLQGVQGEAESEGPSESECRPYIEKALKELEIGEASDTGTVATEDSKEDVPTVEVTVDEFDHQEGEGEDEIHEEVHESTESVESDQNIPRGDTETEGTEEETSDEGTGVEKDVEETETTTDDLVESQEAESTVSEESEKNEEFKEAEEGDDEGTSAEIKAESAEKEESRESVEGTENQEVEEDSTDGTKEESVEIQPEEEQPESNQETEETKEATDDVESVESEKFESVEEVAESVEHEQVESDEARQGESVETEQAESDEGTQGESTGTEQTENDEGGQTESAETEQTESLENEASHEETEKTKESEETKEDDKSESQVDTKSEEREDDKSETKDIDQQEPDKSNEETEAVGESDQKSTEQDDNTSDTTGEEEEQKAEEADQVENEASVIKSEEDSTEGEVKTGDSEDGGDEEQGSVETSESAPEEELGLDIEIPTELRQRGHVEHLLKLDAEASETEKIINRISEITLRELKKLYENAIKPLEVLYKYRDLSNRHFGDAEIFSKPLILFMGPWSGGKSSIINYLLDNEFNETSLRTGAEPSPAYFNILMYGEEPEILDGTQLAADFTFSGLQKFGQGLEERLRGVKLPSKLLEKVNIVEIPGILEVRKQVSRVFPFNDACQWFIDRADIIFLVYDPSKLDVGPETEAILDQLKGREHQTRIILNKADQVKPEELMRVQGALIWNISPLMSSAQPPIMYTTSLWSRPYESWAPVRLLHAQERAFLRDLRSAVDKRIENKIASARRFAVRVRNHAKMVDCYLTTYYNHKSVFGNRKQVADEIIEHPQDYHIYEGLSTLTNISRYDLPDPDVYRDFFKLNPLYDFQQLSATCTYFRGCPINRLDVAIAYDLPELVGKHKRLVESALAEANQTPVPGS